MRNSTAFLHPLRATVTESDKTGDMSRQSGDYNHSLRSVLHELLERREDERREAALILHDEIGQDLAVLSLQLSILQKRGLANTAHAASIIPELKRVIEEAQRKVRDLEFKLYPKVVELSLVDAVKGLVERLIRERGYVIDYHCSTRIRCGSKQAMCLYRSIENFFRTQGLGEGAQWSVSLEEQDEKIEMCITETVPCPDHAASFELNPLNREYIRSLQGQLYIGSSPNHIKIVVPVI
jgi:glucose-6-phosphate-specific signal transduction histidine kinase